MRKINGKLEPFEPVITDEPEVVIEPTIEERLEAVEAALLEQILKEAANNV